MDWHPEPTLAENYGISDARVRLLKTNWRRRVYRVSTAGRDLIVRFYEERKLTESVKAQLATLVWLEQNDFAAPRVIRNRRNECATETVAGTMVVLTYVEGKALGFDLPSLESLGEALGRLHALDVRTVEVNSGALPRSPFSPVFRVPIVLERLNAVADRVPTALLAAYAGFRSTLEKSLTLEALPLSLVHTDPFPENAVRTPDGQSVLLDWDDAGLGQAVVDLGHALVTCDADLTYAENLRPPRERIIAIMRGYARYRTLSAAECSALALAAAFTPAEYGANHLATALSAPSANEQWRWWWTRHQAAPEAAKVALDYV